MLQPALSNLPGAKPNVFKRAKQAPHRKVAAAHNRQAHGIDEHAKRHWIVIVGIQFGAYGHAQGHDHQTGHENRHQASGKGTQGVERVARKLMQGAGWSVIHKARHSLAEVLSADSCCGRGGAAAALPDADSTRRNT